MVCKRSVPMRIFSAYPIASRSQSPRRRWSPFPSASSSSAATTARGLRASIRARHRRHPPPARPPPSTVLQALLLATLALRWPVTWALGAALLDDGTRGSGGRAAGLVEPEDLALCLELLETAGSSGATRMTFDGCLPVLASMRRVCACESILIEWDQVQTHRWKSKWSGRCGGEGQGGRSLLL